MHKNVWVLIGGKYLVCTSLLHVSNYTVQMQEKHAMQTIIMMNAHVITMHAENLPCTQDI